MNFFEEYKGKIVNLAIFGEEGELLGNYDDVIMNTKEYSVEFSKGKLLLSFEDLEVAEESMIFGDACFKTKSNELLSIVIK